MTTKTKYTAEELLELLNWCSANRVTPGPIYQSNIDRSAICSAGCGCCGHDVDLPKDKLTLMVDLFGIEE